MEGQGEGEAMKIEWMTDERHVDETALFFRDNVDPAYISHSELMWGRANAPSEWSPDLLNVLKREFSARVSAEADPDKKIACCFVGEALIGVALVDFQTEAPIPFAILEDIVVARGERGHHVGQSFMRWIFERMKERGVKRAYIESGLHNPVHHWFEHHGFTQVSVVMMADLQDR